jgi:hypothetical protein
VRGAAQVAQVEAAQTFRVAGRKRDKNLLHAESFN